MLRGHEADVSSAEFSTDGTRIVTASAGTVRIWRVDWSTLLALLRSATTVCLTVDDRQRYLGESESEARAAWEACERAHRRTAVRPAVLGSFGATSYLTPA